MLFAGAGPLGPHSKLGPDRSPSATGFSPEPLAGIPQLLLSVLCLSKHKHHLRQEFPFSSHGLSCTAGMVPLFLLLLLD